MESRLKEDDLGGEFQLWKDEKMVAHMMFAKPLADRIIIQHTQVDQSQKGKGLGKLLFDQMIDYAKSNDLSVIPRCNFTQKMFERFPEYNYLL
ncbi:GNAT family N-acetyltransferase [Roseivirga sp. E12]|uniref:GNAT family N-acetyltransferase n=1 Tax=Roseivirga sp. E12 TaxID=2819237 RepID=UPI001ABC20BE|nr:GNAT family N-acetyltransferase [Roseivirga sp. E12]MBO3697922.1 N-acetyltransferase [Roseivirga sp. E12]